MIAQLERQLYTPEDYLAMEAESETRHEYINGEIVPMAGAMPNHNRITLNVGSVLRYEFRGKPFEAFVADQRLWIPARQIYTYPDVLVIAGELQFQEGRKDTIVNPLVIVEVLSESTQGYDRGDKFAAYRTLPSFQEYVLVDQYSAHVEHYAKTGPKKWEFQEYDMEAESIVFSSLRVEISLTDIYDKVTFEPPSSGDGTVNADA
jgi:Uma2 family endonuclease